MSTLREWQGQVVDWANRKGWWEVADRNDGQLIALMHSEVSEAFESYIRADALAEENRTEVKLADLMSEKNAELPLFVEEMADVVIRIMDWAGHRGYVIAYEDVSPSCPVDGSEEIEVMYLLNSMNFKLSQVLEELRQKSPDLETGASIALFLQDVISHAAYGCQMCSWKLEDAIDAKMAINEKRAYRHGKAF